MLSKKQEKELLKKLPVFPHKTDGTRLNKDELEGLAKLIERNERRKAKIIEKSLSEPFFGVNIKEAYHILKNIFKKGYKT